MSYIQTRDQAHELINRMAPSQVAAVVMLLESMLDPFARALANAPYDDEPVTEDEIAEIGAFSESLERSAGNLHEDVLSEYGLNVEDVDGAGLPILSTAAGPHGSSQS